MNEIIEKYNKLWHENAESYFHQDPNNEIANRIKQLKHPEKFYYCQEIYNIILPNGFTTLMAGKNINYSTLLYDLDKEIEKQKEDEV